MSPSDSRETPPTIPWDLDGQKAGGENHCPALPPDEQISPTLEQHLVPGQPLPFALSTAAQLPKKLEGSGQSPAFALSSFLEPGKGSPGLLHH